MKISQDRVEKYKTWVQETYWEIHEAAALLSGSVEFWDWYNLLDPIAEATTKRKSIGLSSNEMFSANEEWFTRYNVNKELIYDFVCQGKVEIVHAKIKYIMRGSERHPFFKSHTCFVSAVNVIAFAVTEGVILPLELQIASGLYQSERRYAWTEAMMKGLQRQAAAQVFWYKKPRESIEGICREMRTLRESFRVFHRNSRTIKPEMVSRYKFLRKFDKKKDRVNLNFKRERDDIKHLRPVEGSLLPQQIPGIILEVGGHPVFDFQQLKVVVSTIADVLMMIGDVKSRTELLGHPLIRLYCHKEEPLFEKVVVFCMGDILENIELHSIPIDDDLEPGLFPKD